jgi:hypothetical protein
MSYRRHEILGPRLQDDNHLEEELAHDETFRGR